MITRVQEFESLLNEKSNTSLAERRNAYRRALRREENRISSFRGSSQLKSWAPNRSNYGVDLLRLAGIGSTLKQIAPPAGILAVESSGCDGFRGRVIARSQIRHDSPGLDFRCSIKPVGLEEQPMVT